MAAAAAAAVKPAAYGPVACALGWPTKIPVFPRKVVLVFVYNHASTPTDLRDFMYAINTELAGDKITALPYEFPMAEKPIKTFPTPEVLKGTPVVQVVFRLIGNRHDYGAYARGIQNYRSSAPPGTPTVAAFWSAESFSCAQGIAIGMRAKDRNIQLGMSAEQVDEFLGTTAFVDLVMKRDGHGYEMMSRHEETRITLGAAIGIAHVIRAVVRRDKWSRTDAPGLTHTGATSPVMRDVAAMLTPQFYDLLPRDISRVPRERLVAVGQSMTATRFDAVYLPENVCDSRVRIFRRVDNLVRCMDVARAPRDDVRVVFFGTANIKSVQWEALNVKIQQLFPDNAWERLRVIVLLCVDIDDVRVYRNTHDDDVGPPKEIGGTVYRPCFRGQVQAFYRTDTGFDAPLTQKMNEDAASYIADKIAPRARR